MPKPTPAPIPIGFVQIGSPAHDQLNQIKLLAKTHKNDPETTLKAIMANLGLVDTSNDATTRVALLRRPTLEDQRPQVIGFVQLPAGRRLMVQSTGTMWFNVIALADGATFRSGSAAQFEAQAKSRAIDDDKLKPRRSDLGECAIWMESDKAWVLESTGPALIIFQAMKGTICTDFAPLNLPLPKRPAPTPIAKAATPPATKSGSTRPARRANA